jgi:hypothetical protein
MLRAILKYIKKARAKYPALVTRFVHITPRWPSIAAVRELQVRAHVVDDLSSLTTTDSDFRNFRNWMHTYRFGGWTL